MSTSIYILLVLTSLGLLFGFILAYANKRFAMEVNPLIHTVEDVLPKGQCGACGYAGCMAYAEAVVLHADVPPDLCIPGKEAVANMVAELTGKQAAAAEPRLAHVQCAGVVGKTAVAAYEYQGIGDCLAANALFGGSKVCKYGCLGLGTCVKHCPFGAMHLGAAGLPVIDPAVCTGCGKCATVCPKQIIAMIPPGRHVTVNCHSADKGAAAKKACGVACLGCGICLRQCPHGAIAIDNHLAQVNAAVCQAQCAEPVCTLKCPTKAILPAIGGVAPVTGGQ